MIFRHKKQNSSVPASLHAISIILSDEWAIDVALLFLLLSVNGEMVIMEMYLTEV